MLRCTGCGSEMTDAELRAAKAANPKLVACCPERDMQPVSVHLREVDAGTDNACWIVCAKGDHGAVEFFSAVT